MYAQATIIPGPVQSSEVLELQTQMRKNQTYIRMGAVLLVLSLPTIINGAIMSNKSWGIAMIVIGIILFFVGVSMLVYGNKNYNKLHESYRLALERNPQHLPVVSGMTPNSAYNNQAFMGPTSGAPYPPPPGLTSASVPTAPPYQPLPAPGTMYPPADAALTPYPPADASLTPVGVTSQAYGTQYSDWAKATPSDNNTGAPPPSYEDATGA